MKQPITSRIQIVVIRPQADSVAARYTTNYRKGIKPVYQSCDEPLSFRTSFAEIKQGSYDVMRAST
jgi:hypothetical protein